MKMLLWFFYTIVISDCLAENPHHIFSTQQQPDVLKAAFGSNDTKGRSSQAGINRYKSLLETRVVSMLDKNGWIPARLLAKAISLNIEFNALNKSITIVPIRGQVTACHSAPVCLDLACGKCFDPLTSMQVVDIIHSSNAPTCSQKSAYPGSAQLLLPKPVQNPC